MDSWRHYRRSLPVGSAHIPRSYRQGCHQSSTSAFFSRRSYFGRGSTSTLKSFTANNTFLATVATKTAWFITGICERFYTPYRTDIPIMVTLSRRRSSMTWSKSLMSPHWDILRKRCPFYRFDRSIYWSERINDWRTPHYQINEACNKDRRNPLHCVWLISVS